MESPTVTTTPSNVETSSPPSSPTAIRNTSAANVSAEEEEIQVEPTEEELERERLIAKAEQV